METPPGRGGEGPSWANRAAASPAHAWDGFLVGPENALAHAAALALARGERDGVSPLVIAGPSGVGKSRLLAGLLAEFLAHHPAATARLVAAEAFAAACVAATARPEGWAEVRDQFRRLDLLILDDLPTLARTPWVWEELAYTLDALAERGGLVAVSSRVDPGTWGQQGWPTRLVSRLLGGLALAIDRPGLATRRRYLLNQARRQQWVVPPEAIERFAEEADGYRTLDGWLSRLVLLGQLGPRDAGPDPVARAMDTDNEPDGSGRALGPGPSPTRPDVAAVARAVADALGVRVGDLRSATRHAHLTAARHLAIHLARRHSGASVRTIGAFFGGRDPATVRHASRVAAERLAADPALAALVAGLARSWPDSNPSSHREG